MKPDTNTNLKSSPKKSIVWFPGHMKRTTKLIEKNLKGISVIIEVIDARIPLSSRCNLIYKLTKNHPRIIILNKSDLADEKTTHEWKNYFKQHKQFSIIFNSKDKPNKKHIKELISFIKFLLKKNSKKKHLTYKAMITGVPNVGKSSYINSLCGRKKTRVENRPGVTRGEQIIKVNDDLVLLDLPGLLDPKLNSETGYKLSLLGLIKDEIIDFTDVGNWICRWLLEDDNHNLLKNSPYGILNKKIISEENPINIFKKFAIKKGCFIKGNEVDLERTGFLLAKEIRSGKWGKYSLEAPSL